MVTGRIAGSLIDPAAPRFDGLPGFMPVIDGVRHLTSEGGLPGPGRSMHTLCDATYWVVQADNGTHERDCMWCAMEIAPLPARDMLSPTRDRQPTAVPMSSGQRQLTPTRWRCPEPTTGAHVVTQAMAREESVY